MVQVAIQVAANANRPRRAARLPNFRAGRIPACCSETIPLFFIGRNGRGLWVARDAAGRTGGIFLFKRSAVRFAHRNSAPTGCATMVLAERFELDVANRGNPLVAWLSAALRGAAALIPPYPPPIPIGQNKFKGERR